MSEFDDKLEDLMRRLWYIEEVVPNGRVVNVYNMEEYEGERDGNNLYPGQVKISTSGNWLDSSTSEPITTSLVEAWVVQPFGMRIATQDDQRSQNPEERTFNQRYGIVSMPRIGDAVFAMGFKTDHGTEWFVLGVIPGNITTKPMVSDNNDSKIVNRSGASIHLNDTSFGGGAISTSGSDQGLSHMKGLTGNLTMVGNRTMIFAGMEYLSYGQLAKYGDPRVPYKNMGIDVFSESVGTPKFSSVFSNDAEDYFNPFDDTTISTNQKFMMPPSTDDDIIPLTDNTLLLAQRGGGVIRFDDHSQDTDYSRLTMAAASMSVMIGQEYQDLGRVGNSASPGDDAAGIDEDIDVFEIQHKTGAKIKIYDNGDIEIFQAKDRNITIKDDTGDGKIYLGEGQEFVIRHNDDTTTDPAQGALLGPPDSIWGNLGIPTTHKHKGHYHKAQKTQETTYV